MMHRKNYLTAENTRVLRQGRDLLLRLDPHLYASSGDLPVKSGVGAHFRHCLDAYACLLEGIATGRVDYTRRERDLLVERDRHAAIARVESTVEALEALPRDSGYATLHVRLEDETGDGQPIWSRSSVLRELHYLAGHAVHHYAIIALLLRLRGFEPGEAFGVAPSTLQHWRAVS